MRALAWLVVGLRVFILPAWIVAAVAATVALPGLGGAGTAPLDDLVASDGQAAAQQRFATQTFGFPLYSDTVVVARDASGLPPGTQQRTLRAAQAVRRHRTPDLPGLRAVLPTSDGLRTLLQPGAKATTAVSYLFFADSANLDQRRSVATHYAQKYLGGKAGGVVGVSGASPARLAQYDQIEHALPLVTAASVLLILLIVGLAFRSFGAPLVALTAAVIAYLIAIRVLPWLGQRAGATVPAEVEPVVVVLLLGLVTDYSVFFLSETRRRLGQGEPRLEAVRGAFRRTAPIVLTAGLIVAAGTGALAAGKLGFLRAFGPGMAATTLIALIVSITLVPALIALFGEHLFKSVRTTVAAAPAGDERPPHGLSRPMLSIYRTKQLAAEQQTSHWRLLVARILSARPVALVIAVSCIALLGILALGLGSTRLGLDFIGSLPPGNEARRAADAVAAGYAPGAIAPTEVDLQQPGIGSRTAQLGDLEDRLRRQPGVAAVIGPREQPARPAPQVLISGDGGAARFAVIFDSDPHQAPAIDHVRALNRNLPGLMRASGLAAPRTYVGGETQVASETVHDMLSDLVRVGLLALAVNLLLLMLFLRAVVAPLYLIAVSVLGLAASLGVTTFVFQRFLGYDDLTYYVPFATAILLVALGSDYNVFVAGRIWEEARGLRLREAISVAVPTAAKAVTIAGIALAASFALLAVVPLRSFREFAFVMAVGVLIDTFVVRSLVVPSLTSLVGELSWWPGRRLELEPAHVIVDRVAERAGLRPEEAYALTEGTLAALGERITARERRVLARHLPEGLRSPLAGKNGSTERFPVEEFLARAKEQSGGQDVSPEQMRGYASAVLTTIQESAPDDLAYVRAQLSEDYDSLFERRG